jgi:hypothetical protein
MAKAQAEFTSGVMKNETVRQGVADAARETVRSQFSTAMGSNNQQQQQPSSNNGGNRF